MQGSNPLLDFSGPPRFDEIRVDHVQPALDALLEDNRRRIAELELLDGGADWDNFVAPLERIEDRLDRMWAPVSHLNGVLDSAELRGVYEDCLVKLSTYYTEISQNTRLFRAFEAIADADRVSALDQPRRKAVENALRDFRLGGVALEGADRERFGWLTERLSTLGNQFNQNLLDATDHWSMTLRDSDETAGLPQSTLDMARHEAETRGEDGFRFTLKAPSYIPFMTYADNADLRRRMYEAYVTRASETGPGGGLYDNTAIIGEMLKLRREKARLLGFDNYAEYSLASKMAASVEEVETFLLDLAGRALPAAREELAELAAFARDLGQDTLQAWDLAYYSEKLKQRKFAVSEEELRPWFPLPRVLNGMFAVVNRLFGITVRPAGAVPVWHPDVRFYEILDADGELRGRFYVDLYARERKRGGAWMAECINRRRGEHGLQHPVAFLVCNFTPPGTDRPALLTHDEVTTLFHEFGHGLHHLLTRIDVAAVSGINGVAWDAVELPSQFLENWCWDAAALELISGHVDSGEPLPGELLEKLRAGRNFQAAMQMLRQVEFSLFDLRLHSSHDPASGDSVQDVLDRVRQEVAVVKPPSFNRFQNGFSHIFGGGYAAGYYSYKWAEVLSADAFSRFEENGVFDADTGREFLVNILEKGGSADAMTLFEAFRGRKPEISALLRHTGLSV